MMLGMDGKVLLGNLGNVRTLSGVSNVKGLYSGLGTL